MLGLGLGLNKGGYIKPLPKWLTDAGCTFAINVDRQVKALTNPNSPFQGVLLDQTVNQQFGVLWDKQASPILRKTYEGDAMNYFPFNQIVETVDAFGNVFVKIPKFYIAKQDGNGNKGWFVSDRPIEGGYLPECFKNHATGKELAYVLIGKHLGSLSDDTTKLESKPNKYSLVSRNIVQFRNLAKANGTGYQQHDIHAVDILQVLFYVMFGTLNTQAVMQGYTTGQYTASHTATVAENGVNRVILANANADQYQVGQPICIGTSLGGQQIATNREITSITVHDGSNKRINFDGTPVNIAIGNIVYNSSYKTGWSTPLKTGWKEANDGKSPMAFLGIESLYGDTWQFIDGININERQSWVCKNADQYSSNLFAAPYVQLAYVNASVDGHAKEMGFDSEIPFAEITKTAVGASSTTFYSDYYYQSIGQKVAMLGGNWAFGANAGLSTWHTNYSSVDVGLLVGARLLKKPIDDETAQTEPNTSVVELGANVLMENVAGTTADGYTQIALPNGKNPWFVNFDGTDSYMIGVNNANTDILGTVNFGLGFYTRTNGTLVNSWLISKAESSEATTQYGVKITSAGALQLFLNGASITLATGLAINTPYKIIIVREAGTLKCEVNDVETYSAAEATSLTARPNLRLGARSSNVGGTTHTEFYNGYFGAFDLSQGTLCTLASFKKSFAKLIGGTYV